MHPVVNLGFTRLPAYGLAQAMGILLSLALLYRQAKKFGLPFEKLHALTLWVCVGGVLGARIAFVIQPHTRVNIGEIFRVFDGTMSYGFLIGAAISAAIYNRISRLPSLQVLDACVPAWIVSQIMGRIGCFLAGCCYGRPTDLPWGVSFNHAMNASANGIARHPAVLYESFGVLMILLFLLHYQKRKSFDGQTALLYCMLYASLRFFVEFFRGDPRGSVWILSPAQAISLVIFFFAVVGLSLKTKDGRARKKYSIARPGAYAINKR